MARGDGRRDGGFCLLLVVCRCASPGISAQPDDHDRPANPLPTYVFLAVILFELNQPPALHPARIRRAASPIFSRRKQHEACAGFGSGERYRCRHPARGHCRPTIVLPPRLLPYSKPRRLPRGTHRTIVPSNKHSPTEILAACRFTGPWMRDCSCECWLFSHGPAGSHF